MPTETVYPVASPQEEWTPSSAVDHYTLVDDSPWPADETGYVSVAGFTANNVDKYTLGQCPTSIDRIQSIAVYTRIKASPASHNPALHIQLLINDSVVASYYGGCNTGGAWATLYFVMTGLNISRDVYNNGNPTIVLTPLNGSIPGLPDYSEDA